jgi:beta-galactosidase
VEIWAHSNLDEVELFVNGVSAGRKAVERNGHVEWRAIYAPGAIEARGYRQGRMVLTARRETAGAAARVVLRADRARFNADGEDCVVIAAEIQDARGRMVPNADHLVRFEVSGPGEVIGVGNGNPTSLEADRASERRAFNGLCMAIVRSTKHTGRVRVTAASDSLANGRVSLQAMQARPRPSI